uniref:Uncharacterized protein n=1 Tax=Tetradesmus obliquus TaxID=3088 RepID=A0A383WGQ3_TETOB|eukprot:jgi/Sobl393_1/1246/SZX65453.1
MKGLHGCRSAAAGSRYRCCRIFRRSCWRACWLRWLQGCWCPGSPCRRTRRSTAQCCRCHAFNQAQQEAADAHNEHLGESWGGVVRRCSGVLDAAVQKQLAPPGHELLELLCQLLDGQQQQQQQQGADGRGGARGSSSEEGCTAAGVAAGDADVSSSSSSQMEALRQLVWQWQPSLQLCRHLQQQQQQEPDGSSSSAEGAGYEASAQLIQCLCAEACSAVTMLVLSDVKTPPYAAQALLQPSQNRARTVNSAGLAAEVLSSAASTQQLFRQQREQHMRKNIMQQQLPVELEQGWQHSEQQLPAAALAEQLRVLGGALVLRFVASARAAGGPAWQGEVPLQAVVLLGALEQLQGLALVAVRQQDVQQALQAARAAAAADDDDGQQHSWQQQQQQQQQAAPNNDMLLLVQKLLDIVQLTRQFAEVNAALNSSSNAGSPSSKSPSSSSSSSSSSAQPLSCEQLFSPGGPVHALHPEPATLGGWSQLAAAATRTASSGCCNVMRQAQPG